MTQTTEKHGQTQGNQHLVDAALHQNGEIQGERYCAEWTDTERDNEQNGEIRKDGSSILFYQEPAFL